MRILLFGRQGQLGWELQRSLLPLGEVTAVTRQQVDLAEPEHLREWLRQVDADVIVNAAAYTAVDRAEEEESLATRINGDAPGIMAERASAIGALMIHYSTDYVFDGGKAGPYVETDPVSPINAYGRSKLAGELALQHSGADHLVLRTSWVYGARGSNFLLTMLRLMREREMLSVIADQIGTPTWCRLIAEASAQIITRALAERRAAGFDSGIYHLTSAGETSWHGFASRIAELADGARALQPLRIRQIVPIAALDYPSPTQRPANSSLSCAALSRRFGLQMPAWDAALALCMDELPVPGHSVEVSREAD